MEQQLKKYDIVEKFGGHKKNTGSAAGIIKNQLYKVLENGTEKILMHCEKDAFCILCPASYQKVLDYEKEKNNGEKITFHAHTNGYITGKSLYIHQIIMGCYRNGKGTKNISVDHIDRNPLNNTLDNLRIATMKMQQENSHGIIPGTKRERNHHAQDLPEGLEQNMIPKHVTYMTNVYNKKKGLTREYFRIENHPKMPKSYDGCKSIKKTIFEKLDEIKIIIENLENDILPKSKKEEAGLPQYVRLVEKEDKKTLVYEKRTKTMRENLKMALPPSFDLDEQVAILLEKVNIKYSH
jgi:hypothetical protein